MLEKGVHLSPKLQQREEEKDEYTNESRNMKKRDARGVVITEMVGRGGRLLREPCEADRAECKLDCDFSDLSSAVVAI